MSPAGTTHYIYDLGGRLIAEADNTGQTVREYIWLDDMPLAVVADVDTVTPKLWFVHADHLDRPVKMTDGAQAVVWDALYRPFGAIQSITGSAANNLRFPGQYFLIESGLHYNWHRHYDPTLGRYVQADPLGFVNAPSLFAYALSAPTQYIDPEGRFGIWGALGSAATNIAIQFAINRIRSGDTRTALYCIDLKDVALSAAAGFLGPTALGVVKAPQLWKEYAAVAAAKTYVSASGPNVPVVNVAPPSSPLQPMPSGGFWRWIPRIFY